MIFQVPPLPGFMLVSGALLAPGFMMAGVEGGLGGFIEVASDYSKFRKFDFSFDFTQPVFWLVYYRRTCGTFHYGNILQIYICTGCTGWSHYGHDGTCMDTDEYQPLIIALWGCGNDRQRGHGTVDCHDRPQ